MSTRRTTRASSKAISSRGASPAVLATDVPITPARTRLRRSGPKSTPLPAVGVRMSTAYGTNTVAQPSRTAGAQGAEQIANVLQGILDPNTNIASPSIRQRSPSAVPSSEDASDKGTYERSFETEANLFINAGLESSVVDSEDFHHISEDRECRQDVDDSEHYKYEMTNRLDRKRKELEEYGHLNHMSAQRPGTRTSFMTYVKHRLAGFRNIFSEWPFKLKQILTVLTALLALGAFLTARERTSIGEFIPDTLKHPFDADELRGIRRRLSHLESEVHIIQKKVTDVDFQAVKKLQEILPNALVISRKKGRPQIPVEFWHALRDKIRSDHSLLVDQVPASGKISPSSSEISEEKRARRYWEKFIGENQARINQLSDEDLTHRFPQLLVEHDIISRTEIIDMIRNNWDENSTGISSELRRIAASLNIAMRDGKFSHGKFTKDQLNNLASQVARYIPNAQLQAAAEANIQNHINYGIHRVNHFAKGTGATIDRHHTSPSYVFPSQNVWFPERFSRWAIGNPIPRPKQPDVALEKWDEQGDCWCSSAKGEDGFGPSLSVQLGNSISPEEVVVEHIPATGSLQHGAMPREMELLARIHDPDTEHAVRKESQRIFPHLLDDEKDSLRGFVRIAAWIYDKDAQSHIQPQNVPLALKSFGADTSHLIVRSKSNWSDGNVEYTCLYRIRVYGSVAGPPHE